MSTSPFRILSYSAVVLVALLATAIAETAPADPVPTPNDTPASPSEEATAVAAGERELAEPRAVIPRGHEALIGEMLGGEEKIGGGCKLDEGRVDRRTVRATYKCESGDVVLELHHPDDAPSGSLTTERFAVVVASGSPPQALLADVASRIRAREARFEWKWVGGAAPASRSVSQTAVLVSAGVLGLAALAWALQRRLAGGRRPQR
jgi:hypothetical protein